MLVFTIAWIGTRDIYIALIVTFLFIIMIDYLLDDDSMFYILPNNFKEHYVDMFDSEEDKAEITEEDIKKATKVLEKAKKQNQPHFESYKI
jgi:spore germination protein GerM